MATDLFNAITDFEENMIDPELLPDINELGFDYYSSVADAQSSFFAAISQSLGIENEQLGAYDAENPQQAAPTGANGVDQKFNE
jgi:hypothetical protein